MDSNNDGSITSTSNNNNNNNTNNNNSSDSGSATSETTPLDSNPPDTSNIKTGVVPYRWFILAMFSAQNLVNSALWICFVPIQATIIDYYKVTTTLANLLTLLFLLCSLPTTLIAMYVQEKKGLHYVIYAGALCQTVGAWLRYAGQQQFWLLIFGSLVAGPAMACFMSTPSVLAALWFAEDQRAIAVAVASLSGVLGMLVGFILGPAIISTPSDIPLFLLVQALLPTGAAVLLVFFRKAPPLPPCISTTMQKPPLLQSLKNVFQNKAFVLLLAAFSLGLGVFNALTTLVDQIVNPLGYNTDDSGLLGALLIGAGLVGAGLFSFGVEKVHKFKIFIIVCLLGCAGVYVWMTVALVPNNLSSLAAGWALFGFFGLPLLPLVLECGVELTFPTPEVVTNGLLMVFGQTFGVVFTFVVDAMQDPVTRSMINGCWLLFGFIIVACVFVLSFNPEYKRLKFDRQHKHIITKDDVSPWRFFL